MKKLLLLLLSVLVMVPTLAQSKREQKGSALQIGWSEMLKYATYFGKTNITYK
jgi:hypothetical protein